MRKIYLSLFTLILSTNLFAQISLEHSYPLGSTNFNTDVSIVKLSVGDKIGIVSQTFINQEITETKISLYNFNHSLYKTILVPGFTPANGSSLSNIYTFNISDNLFKTDSKIEYLAVYSTYDPNSSGFTGKFIRIYDEDGTTVFSKDSADIQYLNSDFNKCIYNSPTGTKLFIVNRKQKDQSVEVYSLPGTLLSANQPMKKDAGSLSFPIPNPSSELTRIEFELPEGSKTGELIVYNMNGTIMKKYLVDNTFGDLLLNNSDLAPGTYYYQLNAGSAASETKKMMIIK